MKTQKLITGALLIGLPVAVSGGPTVLAQPYLQPPSAAERQEVSTPREWVPFAATLTKTNATKVIDVAGRFFRAADGSTRVETGPPGNRAAVIGINNVPLKRMYFYTEPLGWMTRSWDARHVAPPRLAVDGQKTFHHGETVEGYQVLRSVGQDGTVRFLAPALNGEALIRQLPSGMRDELTQISTGPQPADLFEPPSGVTVKDAPESFFKIR
jgi:hypothetical protein